jgi:hypothetical protein
VPDPGRPSARSADATFCRRFSSVFPRTCNVSRHIPSAFNSHGWMLMRWYYRRLVATDSPGTNAQLFVVGIMTRNLPSKHTAYYSPASRMTLSHLGIRGTHILVAELPLSKRASGVNTCRLQARTSRAILHASTKPT